MTRSVLPDLSASHDGLQAWLTQRKVQEVECMVPDLNGIVRGKILPASKFLKSVRADSLRIASSILLVTVTGDYPDSHEGVAQPGDPDMLLRPAAQSLRLASGYRTPTAFIMCDALTQSGEPMAVAPRHILAKVLDLYAERGWSPVIAPELEFFLTARNSDPDLPLVPPIGRSGRAETASEPYGLEALNDFEDIIEHIYEYCETAGLDIDTMIHESGAAQLEINFNHGNALELADQVTMFKRIVRQVALQHNVYATFMAKPMDRQPGSAMHVHQSLVETASGRNLFADADGADSALFASFVAGLQTYLPECAPLFAPNVNSFRRMRPEFDAPINVQWGLDNRSCGLRVPVSDAQNRRVENRLPGADSNPYIAIAASLACGYLGIVQGRQPLPQVSGSAYSMKRTLPRTLDEALERFAACEPVWSLFGDAFCRTFCAIKQDELDAYEGVVSAWEREHLLLKV